MGTFHPWSPKVSKSLQCLYFYEISYVLFNDLNVGIYDLKRLFKYALLTLHCEDEMFH